MGNNHIRPNRVAKYITETLFLEIKYLIELLIDYEIPRHESSLEKIKILNYSFFPIEILKYFIGLTTEMLGFKFQQNRTKLEASKVYYSH